VFIGPYEHHSNDLPWRESTATMVVIGEDAHGHVALDELEDALVRHRDRPMLIGSFSAASNVTGIVTDIRRCHHTVAPARRSGLLGLRRGRTTPADPDEPARGAWRVRLGAG